MFHADPQVWDHLWDLRAPLLHAIEGASSAVPLQAVHLSGVSRWCLASNCGGWGTGGGEQGQRDVLGYYALLGLDGGRGEDVSETSIKRAFREAALQWHPDQQEVLACFCIGLDPQYLCM